MGRVPRCLYSPLSSPQRAANKWQCPLTAFGLQSSPRMWTDDDVRNICIQHDVLSGKTSSLTEAYPSVTDKCHQPTRFIISCLTTLLNGSQLIRRDRLPCRCISSVRHECSTESVTAFYAMLTHCQIDDLPH